MDAPSSPRRAPELSAPSAIHGRRMLDTWPEHGRVISMDNKDISLEQIKRCLASLFNIFLREQTSRLDDVPFTLSGDGEAGV
jgi:hypothetical protein